MIIQSNHSRKEYLGMFILSIWYSEQTAGDKTLP